MSPAVFSLPARGVGRPPLLRGPPWRPFLHLDLTRGRRRRSTPWTPAEEVKLVQLVNHYGMKKWAFIADLLSGTASQAGTQRTGKQCRER